MFMRRIVHSITGPAPSGKSQSIGWRWLLVLALALSLGGCGGGGGVRNTSRSFRTVVVDAGHGGHDRGTYSSRLILEKEAALDIAQKLNKRLRAKGLNTVMVRSGDYFVDLDERVRISNRQSGAIFVSVHLNESRPRPDIHGVETYYFSGASLPLARRILASVGQVPGQNPRAVKTARFRVLRNNRNPAVLVECGYLSNRAEAERFHNAGYRQKIADAIADAILDQRR
jgi:N-acetylmuramoyl-L-alanine amidase